MLVRIRTHISRALIRRSKVDNIEKILEREFHQNCVGEIAKVVKPEKRDSHEDFLQGIEVWESEFHLIKKEDFERAMARLEMLEKHAGKLVPSVRNVIKFISNTYEERKGE